MRDELRNCAGLLRFLWWDYLPIERPRWFGAILNTVLVLLTLIVAFSLHNHRPQLSELRVAEGVLAAAPYYQRGKSGIYRVTLHEAREQNQYYYRRFSKDALEQLGIAGRPVRISWFPRNFLGAEWRDIYRLELDGQMLVTYDAADVARRQASDRRWRRFACWLLRPLMVVLLLPPLLSVALVVRGRNSPDSSFNPVK